MVAVAKACALAEEIDRWSLTDHEVDFLASILHLEKELGRTPSLRELAVQNEVTQGTIQKRLSSLRSKGYVNWSANASRTLVVNRGIPFLGGVQ